jgi:hypothetical protein
VTSPERLFCHVYGRGKGQAQMIPGWPYSVVAALEPGCTSWTAVLDAVRLCPDDDETEVTAGQVRDAVTRLVAAGHWREGDRSERRLFERAAAMDRPRSVTTGVLWPSPVARSSGAAMPWQIWRRVTWRWVTVTGVSAGLECSSHPVLPAPPQ